jgi:hypothetical protein
MHRCETQSVPLAPVLYEAVLASERLAGMDCANQPLYRTARSCSIGRGFKVREVRWQRIREGSYYE